MGASTSGREAARVVKFSQEGSGRDLLVFSEVSLHSSVLSLRSSIITLVLYPPDARLLSSPVFCRVTRRLGVGADQQENTSIHIIDAQTLNTHITVPVPYAPSGVPQGVYRTGLEGGTWGIAGIAFDPTGDWLYSGTEGSVVEWDLRRDSVGQGVWDMA